MIEELYFISLFRHCMCLLKDKDGCFMNFWLKTWPDSLLNACLFVGFLLISTSPFCPQTYPFPLTPNLSPSFPTLCPPLPITHPPTSHLFNFPHPYIVISIMPTHEISMTDWFILRIDNSYRNDWYIVKPMRVFYPHW